MPCYDGREAEDRQRASDKLKKYEGALCSMFFFLEENGLLVEAFDYARRESQLDLASVYADHREVDLERVGKLLQGCSKDEIKLLKLVTAKRAIDD